ncbi:histone-lysine N-methyltransferase ASHR1-like [Trichogramma pretiosum]|uniref:histone-lysine N-methyltransferase ASHR1-like n=1 Tax=Trichogramma pretiosum TaxID=7493 RepID=UPI000C7199A7|nr:histone-lysine N-methyltransferase ASHR1-like [Trichogramma pretiosum]
MRDFAFRLNLKYEIKNAEESIKARKEGNDLYVKKKHTDEDHKMILYLYNRSIAYAPNESEELMYAYSNRAYLLMHVKKYNEAIDSINKALPLADSTKMKLKLHCQKVKCLVALDSSMKDNVMKEIDEMFQNSKLSIEDTILVSNIIKKTKSAVASMKQYEPSNQKFLKQKKQGLYAKTDFKAGDLVLVEKPCLIMPHFFNQYIFCSHCLAVAWTGIPCETCHDYIFCSLKCKNTAREEYHRIECSITPYLILCDPDITIWNHMSLKFIMSLMNEYGTIGKLKSKLRFSKNHNDVHYDDFSKIEDVIFIGSLLLRLTKISAVNGHEISDIIEISSAQLHNLLTGKSIRTRGFCMGLISSVINHSCAPNIKLCFSDNMKYVYYALEPIARGTQLLDSYFNPFYESASMERKEKIENFVCQCIACKEDWPAVLLPHVQKEFITYKMKFEPIIHFTEVGFIKKICSLADRIEEWRKYKIDKNLIQTVVKTMNRAANMLPQPSLARCMLIQILSRIYEHLYGLTVPFENFCSS